MVWAGVLSGIVLKFAWIDAPRWLTATVFVALGWVAVFAMPQMWSHLGAVPVLLLGLGGLLYTVGAVIYATRRPTRRRPCSATTRSSTLLVIAAAAIQFAVIAFFVL